VPNQQAKEDRERGKKKERERGGEKKKGSSKKKNLNIWQVCFDFCLKQKLNGKVFVGQKNNSRI